MALLRGLPLSLFLSMLLLQPGELRLDFLDLDGGFHLRVLSIRLFPEMRTGKVLIARYDKVQYLPSIGRQRQKPGSTT